MACSMRTWPVFMVLKSAPTPAAFMASLACVAIHCGIPVALQEVAGQAGEDGGSKQQGTDHPGEPTTVAPGAEEELGGEVQDEAGEEELYSPEVKLVEEPPTLLVWYHDGPPRASSTPDTMSITNDMRVRAPNR